MPLFDRYIAVDWSANNGPKSGKDSIWTAEATRSGREASRNPSTRSAAMADLVSTLISALARSERVMVGFDFAFGYPRGAAEAIARVATPSPTLPTRGRVSERLGLDASDTSPLVGEDGRGVREPRWRQLWHHLHNSIQDSDLNLSNRFDVAASINLAIGPHYWGHPHGRTIPGLTPRRPLDCYTAISERRTVEAHARGPQPVWKLTGVGAVGSQTLLGIARLEALRRHPILGPQIAVWPFDTDFERNLSRPITLVEIYPSLLPLTSAPSPKDRAQVEICVDRYAAFDQQNLLGQFLSAPPGLSPFDRAAAIAEEGWIAGVGHEALLLPMEQAA
jgi:hypothetical protein